MVQIDENASVDRNKVIEMVKDCMKIMFREISNYITEGRKVYLVALARKMPRLITRVLKDLRKEEREEYERILSKCVLITEHALPVVSPDENSENLKVLILDDIIITGSTLSTTALDVRYFTHSSPSVCALFVYKKALWPEGVDDINIISNKALPLDICKRYLAIISSYISECELPVDLESPVLHINSNKELIEQKIRSSFEKYEVYTIPSDEDPHDPIFPTIHKTQESLNVLLFSNLGSISNVDFGKLRFFFNESETKLAIFYPHIFTIYDLNNRDLFETEEYKTIWHLILNAVYHDKQEEFSDAEYIELRGYDDSIRREHTLMIIANWLYSLALAVQYLPGKHNNEDSILAVNRFKIESFDLKWLVGDKLANKISDLANFIIKNEIKEPLVVKLSCDIPDPQIPNGESSKYAFSQMGIMSKTTDSMSALEKIFIAIDSMRSSTIERGIRISEEDEPLMTLRSLLNGLKFSFDSNGLETQMHKWLDSGIDHGIIVPRYARTSFGHFRKSWSRFFTPSHFCNSKILS